MPWRNGLGTTLEIAREPADGEHFAWRLSLASLERDSSFSAYPGYRRALVLVEGEVLRLRFRGHGGSVLGPTRRGTLFDGSWRTHCSVPGGPCTDLSLIVRAGSSRSGHSILRDPALLRVGRARRLVVPGDVFVAIFTLQGSVVVAEADEARRRRLRRHDTLLVPPGPRRNLTLERVGALPAQLVILRWRPAAIDGRPLFRPDRRPRAVRATWNGVGRSPRKRGFPKRSR